MLLVHPFGDKAVLNFTFLPNPFWNDLQNLDVNYAPRSHMMDNGIPWRHNLIYEDPCIVFCRISRLDGNKMRGLGQPIHNHPYRVILPLSPRQTYYKIILMSFNFQVGTWIFYWISCSKPPGFLCSAFIFGNLDT